MDFTAHSTYSFLHYTPSLDNLEGVPEHKAWNCPLVNE